MKYQDKAGDRIRRIRARYLDEVPYISIERARYYTEKWRETDGKNLDAGVRVATAMRHVYRNMRHHIDPDDRIAGTWTEHYLGIPIDVERGLFNNTLAIELSFTAMLRYLLVSTFRLVVFMIRRQGVRGFVKIIRRTKAIGAATPTVGTTPMDRRTVNPYRIPPADKKELQRHILPYWKGKTIADKLRERLESSGIYSGGLLEFIRSLSDSTSRNDTIVSTGAALGTWQGHLILDHVTPLKKGVHRMLAEIENELSANKNLNDDETAFLSSVAIALEGVVIYARGLADSLRETTEKETDPARKEVYRAMLAVCERVPFHPAETFREAVQSYWTVKTAVELAVPFNVHAPGRLDQILYPYYEKDIREGRITREEARELLEELFLKIMSHNMRPYSNFTSYFTQRYEGSEPVTLAGLTEHGEDAVNELTYVMLEAAERSKAALNFVVRTHEGSPDELFMTVADLHYNGTSSVSIMNDDIGIRALQNRGFSREDSFDYAITGCVDMCAPGKTGGEGFSALLLSRILDMSLRNGDSMTLIGPIEKVGLETGDPDSFENFEQLMDAFTAQAVNQIGKIDRAAFIRDRLYAEELPAPFISVFMQGCFDNRKDITRGGALYDCEGILFMNSIAHVVDSLYVIKKLIFEERRFTFRELLRAVDSNFVGHENIHKMILDVEGKWGNGNPGSDAIAREITGRLFEETYRHHTYRGGFFAPFINSMTAHTYDGRISIATPDGRRAAKPFAPSCGPYNVDRNGLTGVLRYVAALDFTHVLGAAVNVRLHPSAIGRSEETRRKWISLIKTYFKLGGEQLQPTVVSTDVLRAAQKDPQSYRNIIVKVGGYSAYFTDLGYEIQEEIISRSEHRMV